MQVEAAYNTYEDIVITNTPYSNVMKSIKISRTT